jgi:hypothetical protein
LAKRSPTMLGTSTDSETAKDRTRIERKRLREIRMLEELFRRDPKFPAKMTFSLFKAKLAQIYRSDDNGSYVKDWKGKTHRFRYGEERTALEYAVNLLANRPIKTAVPHAVAADVDGPKTIRTKDGRVVRVWRT